MIELAEVTRIYPMGTTEVRALDGVSVHIDEGEFVAIVGPSGSGKSTMMHLLGCLDRPTAGTYRLADQTVSGLNDRELARIRNRSIGFVFQTFNLISRMSAWENVAVPLFYARQTVTKPTAMAALERVGLADRANHQPNELSGGERQRVAIARAIVNKPRLILADEPTGNLDTRTGEQIMQIFHDLHQAGTTIIVVTHETEIAEKTQRTVSMRDGKIISDGRSERPSASAAAGITRPPGDRPAEPAAAATSEVDTPAAAACHPVLHPSARRALFWTLAGPVCLAVFCGWTVLGRALLNVNPGFVRTVGPVLSLGLFAMMFIAPVLGFINGRKGARWVRLAPAKFTGLRRARVAQWLAGAHFILMICLVGLTFLAIMARMQLGARPG